MDRGAWRATVHGVARVGYDLVTKPPPPERYEGSNFSTYFLTLIFFIALLMDIKRYIIMVLICISLSSVQFSSVQLLSHVQLFATP